MQKKHPHYFVYILGQEPGTDVNIGIADDLQQRIAHIREHELTAGPDRQSTPKLVYYEHYDEEAIALNREKQIKSGDLSSTNNLIASMNPNWLDLSDTLPG